VSAGQADGLTPQEQLDAIDRRVTELRTLAKSCLHDRLLPALAEQGVRLVSMNDLQPSEWLAVDDFFESQVFPVLTPLAVDPGHPFPYVSNLSLSLAVEVRDPERGTEHFARVKVPKSLPRWVPFGRAQPLRPARAGDRREPRARCSPAWRWCAGTPSVSRATRTSTSRTRT
jgi:polyphosphate kinase